MQKMLCLRCRYSYIGWFLKLLPRKNVCVEVNHLLKSALTTLANQSRVDHHQAPNGVLVALVDKEVQAGSVLSSSPICGTKLLSCR